MFIYNELADDSEDEKELHAAEKRALFKLKEKDCQASKYAVFV